MWIIIILVLYFVIRIMISSGNKESRNNERDAQNKYIKQNNVSTTTQYTFESCDHSKSIRYIVDNTNKQILISQTSSYMQKIPYSEIIGCEIMTDSEVTGGIGRAVIGGVVAGGVGAIVGSTTAKKHISTYQVIIYRENIYSPQLKIDLITAKTKTDDYDYQKAVQFATSVNSSIKAIISSTSKEQKDVIQPVAQQQIAKANDSSKGSVADELIKLKSLLDAGVLSQSEFDIQKQRVLSPNENTTFELPKVASNNDITYKVILNELSANKIGAIKIIREVTGLGLAEAKELSENLPQTIANNLGLDESESIKGQFEQIGCYVDIERT